MSSSKYDKIGNYNLSYELLKDAVREFDGYILGLSQNDIWLFSKEFDRPKKIDMDENLDKFVNQLGPRILDRTTGTYFFIDLIDSTFSSTSLGRLSATGQFGEVRVIIILTS